MDIMAPALDRQPSPPPHLARRRTVDSRALVRAAIDRFPAATADEIASVLESWGHQVSAIWISRMIQQMGGRTERNAA